MIPHPELGVDEKWMVPFDMVDPFNDNQLTGSLSHKPDHRYGALVITHVNGEYCPQCILATPKIRYPFDRHGNWHFPRARSIAVYDKLDGTNVLAYQYNDATGRCFTTYKLRLAPVLRNSKWGDFLDMWRELLDTYPAIPELATINQCSISFEMYGSRNMHLIAYAVALECAVLFGVDQGGRVRGPADLKTLDVPTPTVRAMLSPDDDLVHGYGQVREALESDNQSREDDKIVGSEGAVWFVGTDADVVLFKCKPESVEAMHWKAGLSKAVVEMTCWNLLETADELTYTHLVPLLKEEFEEVEIEAFRLQILECIEHVTRELSFRDAVLAAFRVLPSEVAHDKGRAMGALANTFSRGQMRRVYQVIVEQIGHWN